MVQQDIFALPSQLETVMADQVTQLIDLIPLKTFLMMLDLYIPFDTTCYMSLASHQSS